GWHVLELHLGINGTAGTVEVWLDNTRIGDLSAVGTANLGTAPVGQFQIGEAQTARTYDVVLDDAAFGSTRLGPVADGAAPSVPTPAAPIPVFGDGVESGNLSAWTSSAGLVVESTDVRTGGFAAEGNTSNGNTFARKTLGATYTNAYARLGFELKSQLSQVNL